MIKLGWIYVYRFCVVGNTYAIQGSVDHAEECSKIGKKSTITKKYSILPHQCLSQKLKSTIFVKGISLNGEFSIYKSSCSLKIIVLLLSAVTPFKYC